MHSDTNEKQKEASSGLTPIDPDGVAELLASAPSDELIAVVAGTFQALGDPTRLKILYALVKRSCCVRDLAILVGVSESAVSHQLRFLKDRQLVKQRREGTTIYYSLNDSHLAVFFREAEQHADHVYYNLPDHPNV
ncbi:MAG: metalloregulator ArsR/SmtB family transcription factor [Ktedonobacteraceae bacterium]